MKMNEDWPDSRSISSFQTFPRTQKTSNGYMNMNGVKTAVSNKYNLIPASKFPASENLSAIVDGFGSQQNDETIEDGVNGFEEEERIIDVVIALGAIDVRFGFSVTGGTDEGFPPRIDDISPGSPADKGDLEVGDEILEVNGKSLDDLNHTEVISHIHQCIRSRTICLRVKRKSGKIALDLAHSGNVQDAFVIAVEQQARERLEKLSALRKIKPVDMTKLSQQLSRDSSQESQDLNGFIESNSLYVTSVQVPDINQLAEKRSSHKKLNSNVATTKFGVEISEAALPSGHIDGRFDEELELKQEIVDGQIHRSGGSHRKRESKIPRSSSDESISPPPKSFSKLPKEGLLETKSTMNNDSNQHREMAVDVPESFVGATKTTPKYPPPKTRTSNEYKKAVTDQPSYSNGTLPKPVLPAKTKAHKESSHGSKGGTLPSAGDARRPGSGAKPVPVPLTPLQSSGERHAKGSRTPKKETSSSDAVRALDHITHNVQEDQMERIRKYQEDIKKRREEEERLAKEQEFLRNSLRGSKKLQALEQNPLQEPTTGIINTAFELESVDGDDDDGRGLSDDLSSGAEELISSVQRLESHLRNQGHYMDEDLQCLSDLFQDAEFQKALAVHNKVQEVWCFQTPPTPVSTEAQDIMQDILNSLHDCSLPEATELVDLLNKFEFESLMFAHDKIAELEAVPAMTAEEELLDRASQYTEDSIKIVKIDKTNEPLGATVRNEGDSVIIGRIVKGGAAEKSGLLHEGDEILEVNGIEMRGKSVNDVCDILANMTGTLTFLVIPTVDDRPTLPNRDAVLHVKAHFDYDPEDDPYIPCRELGISFLKGDILHVINQEDPNWWQAYREGEEDQSLAGLVPSKAFQQQREAMKPTIVGDDGSKEKSKKGKFLCARKNPKKKKKKVLYSASYNEDYESDEILTYEEVALYYPRANRKRPIVLIGPPNIGRHELRQKLMEDVDRFAAAVPHTSRPKQDGEIDGQDYHFITRQQFESDINSRKFVEHGEYEKNYYGTSLDAIRTVVNSGKICVLNLHPQSLKILKASDLKPYVVFVAPPSLEKLRQNRSKMNTNVKDDELKEIIEKAREMEDSYGHYFDMIVINTDLERAYNQLLQEINILEREPQWVPGVWLKSEIN